MTLAGLVVPTPTLFDADGELDGERNRRYHQGLIANGIEHLFPLGSLGEFPSLEEGEREGLLDAVESALSGPADLWVGVGAPSTRLALRRTRQAEAHGAVALLAVPPYYLRPTEAAIAEYYRAIHRASALPLFAYNIPAKVGYALSPSLVHALAAEGTLTGMKDTAGALASVQGFLAGAPPGFRLFPGDDLLAAPALAAGAAGAVMGLANIAPGLARAVIVAAEAKQPEELARHVGVLDRLARVVALGPFPSSGKYLAHHLRGAPEGYRAPYVPLTDDEERAVVSAIAPLRAALEPYLREA